MRGGSFGGFVRFGGLVGIRRALGFAGFASAECASRGAVFIFLVVVSFFKTQTRHEVIPQVSLFHHPFRRIAHRQLRDSTQDEILRRFRARRPGVQDQNFRGRE